ncbi:hypothetical protein DIS24_g3870 [Lasiodiplodia hormozganensis]|uniref:Uncharacterized protein n=1 Tax=Lasiodiplodia hormozganensis TaxID=869390 RepID=A0AA39YW50_9PEZI|nr:hypothetical protein DIS24_g3870 [Lasiodiplodia hormozganensis]
MTCYYPDGNTISDDVPCDSSAEQSACCGSGATCMMNGLCLNYGLFSRGSCTDSSWESDACPQQCTDYNPSEGAGIKLCTRASNGASIWTCGSQDCDTAETFKITANFTPMVETATCDNTTSSNGTSSGSGGGFSSGQMAGVGAGIGVPLLLAFLVTLFLLLAEKRKRRNSMMDGQVQQHAMFEPMRHHQQPPPAWNNVELDTAGERQELPVDNPKRV